VLAARTGKPNYLEVAANVMKTLHEAQEKGNNQASIGAGDYWARWGVNNEKDSQGTGRPAQFLGQTRALSPGCVLAYAQQILAPLAAKNMRL